MVKYGHNFLHFTYYINFERMIKNFKDKKTEEFFSGRAVKLFSGFKKSAERKLTMFDSATELRDPVSWDSKRLGQGVRVEWGIGRL